MDIIIERVNKKNCPICDEPLEGIEPVVFEDYNGHKQPIHQRHRKYVKDDKAL